ncbi:MAG: methyltransferase [Muribaculaceae bacterium]|nr:methyltransferase [Muribaculaceae bacterium]
MRNPGRETCFRFKQFDVVNCRSAMKVGTDGVLLGAWCRIPDRGDKNTAKLRVLDVGCGTGLIALMIAQRCETAMIEAIEIDTDAAAEASENFVASRWSDRLRLTNGDFIEIWPKIKPESIDLMVSNPPFFTNGEHAPDALRDTARHESALTLDSLLEVACNLLTSHGILSLILPAEREEEVIYKGTLNGLTLTRLTRVTTVSRKPPRRILAELSRSDHSSCDQCVTEHLSLTDGDGAFTPQYYSLVKDFYLKL